MKKGLLSIFLVCIFMLVPVIANAATGTGIETDPYLVSTEEELSEAFNMGGYVKLTGDIAVGDFTGEKFKLAKNCSLVLELNGKIISGKNSDEKVSTYLISNKGTLTINDSSIEKSGKIILNDTGKRLYTWGKGMFAISNGGSLTINGGTIENIGATDVPYAIDNNSTTGDTELIIKGGKIVSKVAAIRAFANSTTHKNDIIVDGGEIKGEVCGIWLQQSNANAQKATLTVNGGLIIGGTSNAIYADVNNNEKASAIVMNINGGTIKNNSATKATISFVPCTGNSVSEADIYLTITGGTILNENEQGKAIFDEAYGIIKKDNVEITGAEFSSDVTEFLKEGYFCKKIEDKYMVASDKVHKISIDEVEGAKVVADKSEAQFGDLITLTIDVEKGYRLNGIYTIDTLGKESILEKNSFLMGKGDIKVVVDIEKLTQEAEIPEEVENEKEVKEMLLESVKEAILKDSELAAKLEGKNIEVEVKLDAEEKNINNEDKEKIEEEVSKENENIKVAKYIDITIVVKDADNGEKLDKLEEVGKTIRFSVAVPEDLPKLEEGHTRIYYIIRNHNGVIDMWEVKEQEGILNFETNKFSTYAIAYKDVKEEVKEEVKKEEKEEIKEEEKEEVKDEIKIMENPKTGDNIVLYVLLAVISICGIKIFKEKSKKGTYKRK